MKGKISVIVPIYKVEEYLEECVASLVSQTYQNLEIILVDDGSPDNCGAMCDAWAQKDERIRVIHKTNGGLSDARNAGIEVATGEYIAFVDSDDWIAPTMYETMMTTLQNEQADICACGIMAVYSDRQQRLNTKSFSGDSQTVLQMLYADTAYPVSAWNKLYVRRLWDDFRFPVGKICEDAFTTYRLIDRADKIVQNAEPLYFYRIRDNSIMTTAFSKKRMDEEEAWRANYEYMSEHYPVVKKSAFDFYLQKVFVLLQTIPVEQRRTEFADEYQFLHGILKKNLMYILFSSRMRMKYRIKFVLDFMRV